MPRSAPWVVGLGLTFVVHAALAWGLLRPREHDPREDRRSRVDGTRRPMPPLLCNGRRCGRLEARQRRRGLEEPVLGVPDFLEATVVPAFGSVAPDPRALPEIETFERPEVFEQDINLDKEPSRIEELVKRPEARPELRAKDSRSKLDQLLSDDKPDPRARAKDLSKLTGFKEGEVGGQGTELRLGSIYSRRVTREMHRVFKVPPFIDPAALRKLSVSVLVTRLGIDGAILAYRVRSRSGDSSFDDAALAAVKQFVPSEGGSRTLPAPEADVLRYVNAKGLLIKLDGALLQK